jgi:hypothetical protein
LCIWILLCNPNNIFLRRFYSNSHLANGEIKALKYYSTCPCPWLVT